MYVIFYYYALNQIVVTVLSCLLKTPREEQDRIEFGSSFHSRGAQTLKAGLAATSEEYSCRILNVNS